MSNNKRNIYLCLLIILLMFLIIISLYRFNYYSYSESKIIELSNDIKNVEHVDISKYQDMIIEKTYDDNVEPLEFSIFNDDFDFSGTIDIKNGKVIITDVYDNSSKQIIDDDIVQILYDTGEEESFLYFYALSDNGNLYSVYIEGYKLDDIKVIKLNNKIKVKAFTTFKYYTFLDHENNAIVVLSDDDKLYLMPNEVPFDLNMIAIEDDYIVYSDRTISTIDGRMLKKSSGKEYEVYTILMVNDDQLLFNYEPKLLIITTDDRVIYTIDDKIYEYKKKISEFSIDEKSNVVTIEYKDGSRMKFNVLYDYKSFTISNE